MHLALVIEWMSLLSGQSVERATLFAMTIMTVAKTKSPTMVRRDMTELLVERTIPFVAYDFGL
jgi:hypothetical protein